MGTGIILLLITFILMLITGPVDISPGEVFKILFRGSNEESVATTIVMESRLPMAVGALCCGVLLSMAGLIMQTMFHNPLAGPSVLGISSGASFGVAVIMLGISGLGLFSNWQPLISIGGAICGGFLTILILYVFSSWLKSGVSLLIVGIMLSYIYTSGISLLNYFSKADEIRNYLIWGLGSFNGLRLSSCSLILVCTVILSAISFLFIKPLNAMLMGERYLESVGYSSRKVRGGLLILTGIAVAVPTAFCGPIGFIGLIVPHICRLLLKSSNHFYLIPASIIYGGAVSMACALIGVLPSETFGLLPINVITPIIGVPVILYLLVNRNKLPYFS